MVSVLGVRFSAASDRINPSFSRLFVGGEEKRERIHTTKSQEKLKKSDAKGTKTSAEIVNATRSTNAKGFSLGLSSSC